MKYPNVICIVYALPNLWLSSMWLSSASMKTLLLFFSSFIFIQAFGDSSESIVITAYSAALSPSNRSLCTHTLLLLCSHGSLPFHQLSVVSVRSCLSPYAKYQSCCVAYVLCMISGHLLPTFSFWCPSWLFSYWITQHLPYCWNSSQPLLNVIHGNPFQFNLGVFFSLPICFPFTAPLARWVGIWLNTFFSVFEKFSSFLVKYPSFLHLKLWLWNKNLYQVCT